MGGQSHGDRNGSTLALSLSMDERAMEAAASRERQKRRMDKLAVHLHRMLHSPFCGMLERCVAVNRFVNIFRNRLGSAIWVQLRPALDASVLPENDGMTI